MKALLWFGLGLLACSVYAETVPVTKNDYAYGLPVEVSGEAAIYRLAVPESVYAHLIKKDFSDLRVFNAGGEVVPHSLQRPDVPQVDESDPFVVPFFPYALIKPGDHSPVLVQVAINDQGTVVSSSASKKTEGEERVSAYLVDVSALEAMPSKLAFSWESPEDSFVAHVSIEGSDDLGHWNTLVSQASLVRLYFAGRELGRREIELPDRAYKYLKLNWPAATDGVRLTEVQAWLSPKAEPVVPVWIELAGEAVADEPDIFEYASRGHFPVEWAEVVMSEANSLVDVKLLSRDEETAPWHTRHSGSFYRLQVDGASLASEPARFSRVNDPHWRLEAVSDLSGLGAAVPLLRLGYTPHQLHFLARGEPPFVLAFGAHEAAPGQGQINTLLARIDEEESDAFIGEARAGDMITLGGKDRLQAPPTPFPWQQVLLWSVLVIGVFVLGTMAWRLGKQMK
ncbi:MAG: DUF3999 domain-containing protein [Pseudomonadota bacterium]